MLLLSQKSENPLKSTEKQGVIFKLLKVFGVEFLITFTVFSPSMVLAYYFDGIGGVNKIVEGLEDQIKIQNLIYLSLMILVGLFFFAVSKYFNLKFKDGLSIISQGLIDTLIGTTRLISGVFLSFSFVYIKAAGYNNVLIIFLFYSLILLCYSTFFSFIKSKMFERKNRPLKGGVMY